MPSKSDLLVADVAAQVLLQVGLLVVVDAHEAVPRARRQLRHQRRLAAGRGPLRSHSRVITFAVMGRLQKALWQMARHLFMHQVLQCC